MKIEFTFNGANSKLILTPETKKDEALLELYRQPSLDGKPYDLVLHRVMGASLVSSDEVTLTIEIVEKAPDPYQSIGPK